MKLVLFGATGAVGQRITEEAITRGHEVLGVVRDPTLRTEPHLPFQLKNGDARDFMSVAPLVEGADAVINSVSPRPGSMGEAPVLSDVARGIIQGMRLARVARLLAVGGASTLEVAPGKMLLDTPDFPEAYKQEAIQGRDALMVYRTEASDLDWTYVSPAAIIEPGKRRGKYRTTIDTLLTDESGESRISYEDFAVAVLDELEEPRHLRRRFGVAY